MSQQNQLTKIIILFLSFVPFFVFGQKKKEESLYKINKITSAFIVGVGFTTNAVGLKILDNRSRVENSDLIGLSKNDIPKFERWVVNQNPNNFEKWRDNSDIVMRSSLIIPAVFLFNKRIRKDWLSYSLLYLKTQAFSANFYTLGVPQFYRKYRPQVYFEESPLSERTGVRLSNSFFSGHTSVTATSMFFMASVYHDLYPERSLIIPLTVATAVTSYVAVARVKGGKHFMTDVVAGAVVGGLIGYLTPHFHSRKRKSEENSKLSLNVGYKNLVLTYGF